MTHTQEDATSLPSDDNTFDACRSKRLFQSLLEPAAALDEMVRVTRPGSRVVVADTDWGTLVIDTSEPEIERRLVRILAEELLLNGYSGRQLYRLFKKQGLLDVAVELFPMSGFHHSLTRVIARLDEVQRAALGMGQLMEEELERWHGSLEQADQEGISFASLVLVLASGTKGSATD